MDTKKLYWLNDNYKRPLLHNKHKFYQFLVNKTLSFINNILFYQLIVNKNTIFYDDRKPEATTAV